MICSVCQYGGCKDTAREYVPGGILCFICKKNLQTIRPKYEVFRKGSSRGAFRACVKAGYRPLTAFETLTAIKQRKIPHDNYYDCATFDFKSGVVGDATPKDIKAMVCTGKYLGRVWRVGVDGVDLRSGASSGGLRNNEGVLAGVKE